MAKTVEVSKWQVFIKVTCCSFTPSGLCLYFWRTGWTYFAWI